MRGMSVMRKFSLSFDRDETSSDRNFLCVNSANLKCSRRSRDDFVRLFHLLQQQQATAMRKLADTH